MFERTRYAFLIKTPDLEPDLNASFLFDASSPSLELVLPDSDNMPWMLADHIIPNIPEGQWEIVKGDKIPPEITKWRCLSDGCEMAHCRRCGYHYDPYVAGGGGVCDACQIQDGADAAQREAEAFGGDYEKAERARLMIGEFSPMGGY